MSLEKHKKTSIIPGDDPEAIGQALARLAQGGLVAFPTDTVYGLGASAFSTAAIDGLFEAKGREASKAIAILIGDVAQAEQLSSGLNWQARRFAEHFWPGPLTLVVARQAGLPDNLSPYPTIGLRVPNHPLALRLLRQSGPLAVTSANVSGRENTFTAQEVLEQLGGRIDLIVDGGKTPGGVPSTVVDCTGEEIRILREGPISAAELRMNLE